MTEEKNCSVLTLKELLGQIAEACSGQDFKTLKRLFEDVEMLEVFSAASEAERKLFFPMLWKINKLWRSFWLNDDIYLYGGAHEKELKEIFYSLQGAIENITDEIVDNTAAAEASFNKAVMAYYALLKKFDK